MAESEFIENLDLKYYPHFDKHLSKSKIAKLVNNRDAVKKHPFHPFLYFEQKFTKFRLEKGLAPVKKNTANQIRMPSGFVYLFQI